ncbi:hypothetical protein C0V77_11050 [Emticicia sp. TH156]|nr:hypothetical protein C0V77_11050 [Emticicia sp. TH156]
MIEEHIGKKGDIEITGTITGDFDTTSVADELRKLKDLLDEGALTKEEFEAQKKIVLRSRG